VFKDTVVMPSRYWPTRNLSRSTI